MSIPVKIIDDKEVNEQNSITFESFMKILTGKDFEKNCHEFLIKGEKNGEKRDMG